MELGFGLITCERYPGDPRSDAQIYEDAISLAVDAERFGFDSVWVSEHHFVDDGYLPSLLPMCAAIAARTSSVLVGTGVVLAPLHDPLRLAEDAAVVDLIAAGRLVLGLGLGWREEEFAGFGVPLTERAPRLEGSVEILRQAWSSGAVPGTGGRPYPNLAVTPKPAREGGPPIWIGAMTERAVRRAGRIAEGLLATEVTPTSVAEQVAWALDERERTGGDPGSFALAANDPVFAWPGADAWERIRDSHHYVAWKYEDMDGARSRTGPPALPPALTGSEEAELREQILVGTPQEVAEGIGAFRRTVGDRVHFIARLYWPGLDPGVQREALELFAEDVMPLLR